MDQNNLGKLRLILDRSNVLELILLLKGYSKYVG